MNAAGKIAVSLAILIAWFILLSSRRQCCRTTLTVTANWSLVAAIAWTSTWFADQCFQLLSTAVADHVWYACAVLALCPPIAVLGSRRPGTRVWTWFILLPMLLALFWPIAALRLQGSELRHLQLEAPQLMAFCLVLIMGVGNYCGTSHTISALFYGAALLTLVVSSSVNAPEWLSPRDNVRFWCMIAMTLAILLVKTNRRTMPSTQFDRLWFDFFDLFGIVWGRRIQDRVNFIARRERLPIRLELQGFVWLPASPAAAVAASANNRAPFDSTENALDAVTTKAVEARVDHILRWLLRRFVDPIWIDERLGPRAASHVTQIEVDS